MAMTLPTLLEALEHGLPDAELAADSMDQDQGAPDPER